MIQPLLPMALACSMAFSQFFFDRSTVGLLQFTKGLADLRQEDHGQGSGLFGPRFAFFMIR